MGVGNSKFLSILGITDNTPSDSIPGGTIVKENNKVTGLLLENAHMAALQLAVSNSTEFPKDSMLPRLLQAEQAWFRYGITTMCEGRADPNSIALIQAANGAGKLTGDFIVLPDYDLNKAKLKDYARYYNKYDGHFKIGAFKFTFDGSPQGRSAYLSHPYLNPPVGSDSTYKGHPIYPYDSAAKYVEEVLDAGMPVHVHCNGDAAIDMVLSIFTALKNKNKLQKATPNVIIHTQICREDQLAKMKTLAGPVMESFFPTHVYLWGNWYRDVVLGLDRARHISPWQMRINITYAIPPTRMHRLLLPTCWPACTAL
jgi:predicted amidohydrolase YtcJ